MSTPPSEDMLVQRQLRAAEIALETSRRRRFETDESIREMRAVTERAEYALADSEAARERSIAEFQAELAAERARTADAEQRYTIERNRRLTLDQQLSALRREADQRDETARQLAAETRIRQLEGELELVSRRAAEFEYGVRMATLDALKLVRGTTARVDEVLGRASAPLPTPVRPESPRLPAARQVPTSAARRVPTSTARQASPSTARPASPPLPDLGPVLAAPVDAERLEPLAPAGLPERPPIHPETQFRVIDGPLVRPERADQPSEQSVQPSEQSVQPSERAVQSSERAARPQGPNSSPGPVPPSQPVYRPGPAPAPAPGEPPLRPEDTPVRWTEPAHWQVTRRRPHEFGASQRPPDPPSAPLLPATPLELAPNVPRHPEALKPPPVAAILDSQLDSHRLDEALERLRASSAAPEEQQ